MMSSGLQPSTQYHGSVGAAFEGWMKDDPSSSSSSSPLLLAMCTQLLAMARPRAVMILKCRPPGDAHTSPVFTISLPRSEEGHQIKVIQWLVCIEWSVLAVGTSLGSVLFFSSRGSLLLRQCSPSQTFKKIFKSCLENTETRSSRRFVQFKIGVYCSMPIVQDVHSLDLQNFESIQAIKVFYGSPVLQLRVRGDVDLLSSGGSEELSVVYSNAIVQIDMADLQPLLRKCLYDVEVRPRRGRFGAVAVINPNDQNVVYQIWDISRNSGRASACVDGVVSRIIALPLFDSRQPKQKHYCAITVGPNNVFTVHRLIDDKSSSIASIIMNKIVPAVWSTFTSWTRIFWQDNFEQKQPLEAKPQEFGRASLMTALKDEPRKGERIALSPSGTLAALTDSLGRVLLIDMQALIVIRLWKGYRDAHCFFLDVPVDDKPFTDTSFISATRVQRKHDYFLSLAIYAPRRGIIEIWKLRNGPRLSIIKCGHGFHVIQPAIPLHGSVANTGTQYAPAELYILHQFSGDIAAIRPRVP